MPCENNNLTYLLNKSGRINIYIRCCVDSTTSTSVISIWSKNASCSHECKVDWNEMEHLTVENSNDYPCYKAVYLRWSVWKKAVVYFRPVRQRNSPRTRKQLKQQAKRDLSPGIYYLSRYYLFYSRPLQLLQLVIPDKQDRPDRMSTFVVPTWIFHGAQLEIPLVITFYIIHSKY